LLLALKVLGAEQKTNLTADKTQHQAVHRYEDYQNIYAHILYGLM